MFNEIIKNEKESLKSILESFIIKNNYKPTYIANSLKDIYDS